MSQTRTYACGLDADLEVTCEHCPHPDGCIDYAYDGLTAENDDPIGPGHSDEELAGVVAEYNRERPTR